MSKHILYYPPPPEVIHDYAHKMCEQLGETQDAAYTNPEVVTGFTDFLHLVSAIWTKHLNSTCENEDKVANPKE